MSAQVTKQQPKYVKSLLASSKLEKGKVYEVIAVEFDELRLRDGTREMGWFLNKYFEPMPLTYDYLEEKLRAILTTPAQPCTCKKCSAPLPCSYHG